ncbi:ferredoxin reductase family protein [soil metagenome]
MKFSGKHTAMWVSSYVFLVLSPLLLAIVGPLPPARTFWVELSVGLGFVGLAMMAMQVVLSGRIRNVARSLGLDTMLQFHRQAGIVAFAFILSHPVILLGTNSAYLDFLDPRVNFLRALALSAVIGALVLLIVSTLWREQIGLRYEWWRSIHALLALFVIFVGLVHTLQVQYYVSGNVRRIAWIVGIGTPIALMVKTRVIRPLQLRRIPYRVVDVREELGNAWTIALAPEGHAGMRFTPGQFSWITLGPSPFSLTQHPFSFSSSADKTDAIELTIKELGDFTNTVGKTEIGTTAFLEGPFGAFTPPDDQEIGIAAIVAGVGITPIMSMLRTFRDRKRSREVLLMYGNSDWDTILFRNEIAQLENELNLEVVHVLSSPDNDWDQEAGYITDELLDRYLPKMNEDRWQYFVCGPEGMMDEVESHLRSRGVPLEDIFSERFQIV